MGKGKLEKFADMREYPHVFEYPYSVADNVTFDMKGNWNRDFFKNDNPIVLELGCGRGEYTVGLGRMYSDKNFIGVDMVTGLIIIIPNVNRTLDITRSTTTTTTRVGVRALT